MRKGFISYSHADRKICDALVKHLGDLHRTSLRIWRDTEQMPGDDWNELIGWHIKRTHVALVLISADAMKPGGFIPDIELPRLEMQRKKGFTRVVPAKARAYDLRVSKYLSTIEAVPDKGRSLGADASDSEIDDWCASVAAELRELVESLPALEENTPAVRKALDAAQSSLDALEACDPFFDLDHRLVNDCQKLISGLQAALRAPRADFWATVDGLTAKWAAFRRDRLTGDRLDAPAGALEARLDALLATIEAADYDWPPKLERARKRPKTQRNANPELVAALDEKLAQVEQEARILGQPGEAHLKDMEADARDEAVIGQALLVGPKADLGGARHAAANVQRTVQIIESEIKALCDGKEDDRDLQNAQRLRQVADEPPIPVPELAPIPPGRFLMGAAESEQGSRAEERPLHEVTIAYTFALGRFAVTFDEYDAFCHETGAEPPEDEGWGRGNRPAINVYWDDAQAYLRWLNEKLNLAGQSQAFRLPSEAEWEYACRAGTQTPFSFGGTITPEQANYDGNETYGGGPTGTFHEKTMPVGSYPANALGLFDMHGNVWEWCADRWHETYTGAPEDGSVWAGGYSSLRVLRGGSWGDFPRFLRSAFRLGVNPSLRGGIIGFRVARTL